MNKQTLFVTLTTAALMCGCQSSKVKISGRFVGGDAKNIYLEQVLPLTQSVVDSAALAPDGSYRMELTGVAKTPSLYNVIYDGERIPLLLAGGDRLTLGSVGSVIRNYTAVSYTHLDVYKRQPPVRMFACSPVAVSSGRRPQVGRPDGASTKILRTFASRKKRI